MTTMLADTIDVRGSHSDCSESRILLLDVRTGAEFDELHAEGAVNIPLHELNPNALAPHCAGVSSIHLLCRTGQRAATAQQQLKDWDTPASLVILGGTVAWEEADLPVIRGKARMSLERQVRIAAGTLVATGALLALFVNPMGALLSLFVGCGLVFAGITDTCGMGMLLVRMPWNRRT